jgi:Ser/Thr protein kinase RdoA (MazF antagonist)
MKKVQGRSMSPKVWDPNFVRRWGQVIGKLHRVTQAYPDWHHCTDPESGKPYLIWESEWEYFQKRINDTDVLAQWKGIGETLRGFPVCRECYGFIHNDPHIWNLRVNGDRVTLLDFDVALHFWFANDIAISCQHVLTMLSGGLSTSLHHPERLEQFLKVFLDGYFRENDLDKAWIPRLEVFFAYRRILSFTFMDKWFRNRPERVMLWKEMIKKQPPLLAGMSL